MTLSLFLELSKAALWIRNGATRTETIQIMTAWNLTSTNFNPQPPPLLCQVIQHLARFTLMSHRPSRLTIL